jgi:hypothetical protein
VNDDQRLFRSSNTSSALVRGASVGAGISNCPSLCVLDRTEKRLVWSCWEIGSTIIRPATRRRRRDGGGKGEVRKVGQRDRASASLLVHGWLLSPHTYLCCYAFGTRGRPVELCQQALAHHLCPELHHPCLLPATQRVRGRPHASCSFAQRGIR